MFALVKNGSIISFHRGNKGITINDTQYPSAIFSLWTSDERKQIGIYEIEIDTSNKKNGQYYINTDIEYNYDDILDSVRGVYGIASIKDVTPIKENHIKQIKLQAISLLKDTDWYVLRKFEDPTKGIPAEVSEYRNSVRAKSDEMEIQINATLTSKDVSDLYEWTDIDGVSSRPLVSFPEEI